MTQLPDDFCRQTIAAIGDDEFQRLAEALAMPAPTSLRINPNKACRTDLGTMLDGAEPVEWCEQGFYLKERPQFTFDPLLHAGCYYVQEASSMVVGKVIRDYLSAAEKASVVALDACAAPGGKSTLALDCLPTGSLLVANEYVRQRAHILAENLTKWGDPNIIVTNSDTSCFTQLGALFDIIICDAPCSGEGMFRKDPKAIDEWSLDNVSICQARQREIVANLWPSLKPGGLLIYSTCTFNRFENEDNAEWMKANLGAVPFPFVVNDGDTPKEMRHFYPHLSRGEGFFISAFTKSDDEPFVDAKSRKQKKTTKAAKVPSELSAWLTSPSQFSITQSPDGAYCAFPTIHNNVLERIASAAHVVHYGIALAESKGNKIQPCHSLAMSLSISEQAFPKADVDYATAIAYLRGEAITLPADCAKGFVLIAFDGHTLGFAKNIGNRANNLYPAEWRIKSTHVPEQKK